MANDNTPPAGELAVAHFVVEWTTSAKWFDDGDAFHQALQALVDRERADAVAAERERCAGWAKAWGETDEVEGIDDAKAWEYIVRAIESGRANPPADGLKVEEVDRGE
jgi:hypothetical protein